MNLQTKAYKECVNLTAGMKFNLIRFVKDFDMQFQGVFKDYSRTKMKIFKEL